MIQNDKQDSKDTRIFETSLIGSSDRPIAIMRLGTYLCHLKTMQKMSQTSPEEDRHIELLTHGLSSGLVDLEVMLATLPEGSWRSYVKNVIFEK